MISKKTKKLAEIIKSYGRLAIAFSGGYDSSFLAKFAIMTIGAENVMLFHVRSPFSPSRESLASAKFAKINRVSLHIIRANPLDDEKISANPGNRCYLCKKKIMRLIIEAARGRGIRDVADGSNLDDLADYRPGSKACEELKIKHPLTAAKLEKKEMIKISEAMNFNLSFCPSSSCLATRIPCGVKITSDALKMSDKAENILRDIGIASPRVRVLSKTACIEVNPEFMNAIIGKKEFIIRGFKRAGFERIHLDIEGYRKGSMNN
jgi:uncharacterized protein